MRWWLIAALGPAVAAAASAPSRQQQRQPKQQQPQAQQPRQHQEAYVWWEQEPLQQPSGEALELQHWRQQREQQREQQRAQEAQVLGSKNSQVAASEQERKRQPQRAQHAAREREQQPPEEPQHQQERQRAQEESQAAQQRRGLQLAAQELKQQRRLWEGQPGAPELESHLHTKEQEEGTSAAAVPVGGDSGIDPGSAATTATRTSDGDGPRCRFAHNWCALADRIRARWTSCCDDPTCPETCGNGLLPPGSQTFLLGNSHMNEIAESMVCANLHMLTHVTWTPGLDKDANSRIMLGMAPPPTVTWTYSAERDELRDELGEITHSIPDSVAAYTFSNGARLFSVSNTPMQLHAGLNHDPRETPFSLAELGRHLGFDWRDITGVLFNEANFRGWAYKLWCTHTRGHLEEARSTGLQSPRLPCKALADPQRALSTVVDLDHFVSRLSRSGFRGNAVLTRQLMQDTRGCAPPPPMDVTAAPTRGKFNLKYFDWTYVMNGRLCAAPHCYNLVNHMCQPGPPGDLARIALRMLYPTAATETSAEVSRLGP